MHATFGVNFSGGGGAQWDFYVYNWRSVGISDAACINNSRTNSVTGGTPPPSFTPFGSATSNTSDRSVEA